MGEDFAVKFWCGSVNLYSDAESSLDSAAKFIAAHIAAHVSPYIIIIAFLLYGLFLRLGGPTFILEIIGEYVSENVMHCFSILLNFAIVLVFLYLCFIAYMSFRFPVHVPCST